MTSDELTWSRLRASGAARQEMQKMCRECYEMATTLALDLDECKERFSQYHTFHQVCPACLDSSSKSSDLLENSFFNNHLPHAELVALLESKLIVLYVRPYGKPEIKVPEHPAFTSFLIDLGMQHRSVKYEQDKRCYLVPWTYNHSNYGWWTTVEALNDEGFGIVVKQSQTIKRGVTLDDDICNYNCKAGDPSFEGTLACTCVCGGKHHGRNNVDKKGLHKYHFVLDGIDEGQSHRTITLDRNPDEGLLIKQLRSSVE